MESKGKIEYFALLRGIAILMIIFTHIHQVFQLPLILSMIPRFGQMGCQVFFLISGFFAYKSLTPIIENGNTLGKDSILKYYQKRLKRIAPGYWLTILLSILLAIISIHLTGSNDTGISTKTSDIAINVLLLNGLAPTMANNHVVRGGWFVGTLVIFYVLTPLLFYFYQKLNKITLIIPAITFVLSAAFLIGLSFIDKKFTCWNNSFYYFSFVNQLPCFLLGFSLCDLYLKDKIDTISHPVTKGILLATISIVLFYIGYWRYNNIVYAIVPFIWTLSVFYLSCVLIKMEINTNSQINKTIIKFGEIDFAIMLIHPFIVFDLFKVLLYYSNWSHTVLFFICIPVGYTMIYFVSALYKTIIDKFTALIFK